MCRSEVGPIITLWTGHSLVWRRSIVWLKVMQILKYQEHFWKVKDRLQFKPQTFLAFLSASFDLRRRSDHTSGLNRNGSSGNIVRKKGWEEVRRPETSLWLSEFHHSGSRIPIKACFFFLVAFSLAEDKIWGTVKAVASSVSSAKANDPFVRPTNLVH